MAKPVKYHKGRFPPKALDLAQIFPLVGPANVALGRYDGLLHAIPNPTVLLSPLTTQEAVLSSRIEGTQATMGEVLEYEAGVQGEVSEEKREDIHEVQNYRSAMVRAIQDLRTIPLSRRLLCDAHKKLMAGVRGKNKAPGQFRKIQNWIGPKGSPIEQATFIPIAPQDLADGISTWEKYIHSEPEDRLVQLAILHVEFEALHPFLDGNGRLGRMLIPLFLFSVNLLSSPTFYISAYFEEHREEYYERLRAVSRDDDWTGWCKFFLQALISQAKENEKKARAILSLYEDMKQRIVDLTHSQYSIATIGFLFDQPLFSSSSFIQKSGIPSATARRILRQLSKNGILKVFREAKGRQGASYVFSELLNIAEGRKVF